MKVVRLSAIRTGPFYPPINSLYSFHLRGWVDPRTIMRPEGLYESKIPTTPSGIESAVAQCLNQLRHRAHPINAVNTLNPKWTDIQMGRWYEPFGSGSLLSGNAFFKVWKKKTLVEWQWQGKSKYTDKSQY
jgi:hypothetical protein